jgi:O-antigen/teichoic acid export membrane protein
VKQSSLISHAALSTAGVLVQGLSRFAFTALIGRFMGPTDLAHVSAWLALALILSLLWPTGAGNAASHFLSGAIARGENPTAALRALEKSFWLSCVVMVALGVPIALIWLGSTVGDTVAVALLIVSYSGYIFTRGIQVGLGRILDTSVWDFVSALVTTLLLVGVLSAGASAFLLWPLIIGYSVFVLRVLITARGGHGELLAWTVPTAQMWPVIRWNSLGLLASNGLIQFSMLFVFAVATPVQAGLYAAAMSLATPASMLSQAISQVLLARFSAWAATDTAAHRKYAAVLGGMSVMLAVVFGVVALFSGLIIQLVFGSEYAGAVTVMQLLLAAVFAFSITLVANAYLLTTNRTSLATMAAIVGLVAGLAVMVGGFVGGVSGPLSGAIAVLVGYAVSLVITVVVSLMPRVGARPLPRDRSTARLG